MNKSKKILIAVCAAVLAAAVIFGVLYAVFLRKSFPDVQTDEPINVNSVYVVSQPPYTDRWIFDSQMGMTYYWGEYHSRGNGIEVVLQQSKDGELIMLSEALPAKSNADDLYGSEKQVGDLTLEELRQINLWYDLTNEEGFQEYVDLTGEKLTRAGVVTLDEMLEFFGAPGRVSVKLYLRFFDETKITDLSAALKTIYDGMTANHLEDNVVFCPQSDKAAAAADEACPDLARAATTAEAKALYNEGKHGKAPDDLPYSVIYEKVDDAFGSEEFIRYVRSSVGLDIVLSGVSEDDVLRYRNCGVTALATSDAKPFIQILKDAMLADRESKKAAN